MLIVHGVQYAHTPHTYICRPLTLQQDSISEEDSASQTKSAKRMLRICKQHILSWTPSHVDKHISR